MAMKKRIWPRLGMFVLLLGAVGYVAVTVGGLHIFEEAPDFSASAASSAAPQSTAPASQTSGREEAPAPSSATPEQGELNSLTGLPVAAGAGRRPTAVMINNLKQAQPLLGISRADVVYECLVEGGITRLMALYQDPTAIPVIGSVRSARPYYIHLAAGHDAVYVHAGGSEQALAMLKGGALDSFNLGNYPAMMWRDPARRATLGLEHSLVTSGEKLQNGFQRAGIRMSGEDVSGGLRFGEDSPVLEGESAGSLTVRFSSYKSTTFTLDAGGKDYKISQFGAPQMDGEAKVQNTCGNALVLFVNTYPLPGSPLMGMDLSGSGQGYYMSRGRVIPIGWSRAGENAPFQLTTRGGEPLTLLPGRSYLCLAPLNAPVSFG
jgi:hypothetical protein